jgi:hypothetical protein
MRSTRGKPWLCVLGPILLAALLLSAAAQGDDDEPIRVTFHAPSDCPSAASFFDQVRARTTKVRSAAPGEAARAFNVTILEKAGKVHGRLTIEDPPAPPALREVTGEKCSEIVSALALITALAVDPRASTAPSSSLPAPPPEEHATPAPSSSPSSSPYHPPLLWMEPIPPPLPVLLPPPLPAPRWRFTFGVDLAVLGAVAPSIVVGTAWFVDAERPGPSIVSPTFRASIFRADSGLVGRRPIHSRFQWLIGRIEGCPLHFSPHQRVGIWPCVLLDVGALEASGWGRTSSSNRARPWIAPGALGRIQWDFLGPLLLEAEGRGRRVGDGGGRDSREDGGESRPLEMDRVRRPERRGGRRGSGPRPQDGRAAREPPGDRRNGGSACAPERGAAGVADPARRTKARGTTA